MSENEKKEEITAEEIDAYSEEILAELPEDLSEFRKGIDPSLQEEGFVADSFARDDSGLCLDFEPIAEQTEEKEFQANIFYHSLESPNSFCKKLPGQFDMKESGLILANGNVAGGKNKDERIEYHNDIEKILSRYFDELDADIVVLGEYIELRDEEDYAHLNYKKIDSVGYSKGIRAMTIYVTTKREIPGCRISSLDGEKVNIQYLDKGFEEERLVDQSGSDERLLKLSQSSKNKIGESIEVMIFNRYMLFVHALNKHAKNAKGVKDTLGEEYIKDGSITYIVAGDLNIGIQANSSTTHDVEKDLGSMIFKANTSADSFSLDDSQIQEIMNKPGKTCSSSKSTAHDGAYLPTKLERTEIDLSGSLWALVKGDGANIWKVMSDHKGFLLKISGFYSGRDSPTRPFTPIIEIKDEGFSDSGDSQEKIYEEPDSGVFDESFDEGNSDHIDQAQKDSDDLEIPTNLLASLSLEDNLDDASEAEVWGKISDWLDSLTL